MPNNLFSYGYELDKLVNDLQFVPYKLKKSATHEVGKIYWCSYWKKWYKVLEVRDKYPRVKIEWQDGKISEHSTSLDTLRDYELRPFEFTTENPINQDISLTAAEIKALCFLRIISDQASDDLKYNYFSGSRKPNDYNYYYVETGKHNVLLRRDTDKSPRK